MESSTDNLTSQPNQPSNVDSPSVVTSTTYPPQSKLRSRTRINTTDPPSSPNIPLQKRVATMFKPEKKVGPAPSIWESLKAIFFSSWLNVMLVFIPISWVLHWALPSSNSNKDTLVFVFSFLAIIPLAKLMGLATEELSLRVGQTLAGLMNATLGNAVELIVAIIALVKCELRIVQASLVGSVLSNLLLVLGMCFFAGGLKYSEQGFGISATQLNSSLLTISVIAVLLPAAFHFSANLSTDEEIKDILSVSRGVSIILLVIYGGYLWFQLVSHTVLYQDQGIHVQKSTEYARGTRKFGLPPKRSLDVESSPPTHITTRTSTMASGTLLNEKTGAGPTPPNTNLGHSEERRIDEVPEEEDEGEEIPQMSVLVTIILLASVTVLVAITAEWLLDSINGLTSKGSISQEFVGIILLPIVGNAAEHVTAVTVSVKDKLNLSLGVAVGSSIQIALFVIPFIVTLAWILGKPLTMLFDPYESVALFLAVLTVNYVVQDGKSNWLEGFILMGLYIILAVTFWYYPGSDPSGTAALCH